MMREKLIGAATVLLLMLFASTEAAVQQAAAQQSVARQPVVEQPVIQQPPVSSFKAGIDLVQVSAVVRDRKGRFVQNLSARDFEILDGGQTRPISDFRHDLAGVTVALLFDVSGSMEARLVSAREAGMIVTHAPQQEVLRDPGSTSESSSGSLSALCGAPLCIVEEEQ